MGSLRARRGGDKDAARSRSGRFQPLADAGERVAEAAARLRLFLVAPQHIGKVFPALRRTRPPGQVGQQGVRAARVEPREFLIAALRPQSAQKRDAPRFLCCHALCPSQLFQFFPEYTVPTFRQPYPGGKVPRKAPRFPAAIHVFSASRKNLSRI